MIIQKIIPSLLLTILTISTGFSQYIGGSYRGFPQVSRGEKKAYTKKYKDFLDADAELKRICYHKTLEQKQETFIVKTFNPDKMILTMYETYSNRDLNKLNGRYMEWYDNGFPWKEGQYENNKREGTWKEFSYDTGKLKKYGVYKNELEEGKWYSLDSLGRHKSESNYSKGKLHGVSLKFDTSGSVYQKIIYEKGEEIENIIIDSVYFKAVDEEVDVLPMMESCMILAPDEREDCRFTAYLTYVYGNITYPSFAKRNSVEGTAIIRFAVDKDGSLKEITALRGVCEEIENECIKIVKNSPNWVAGIKNDKPVKVYFDMPVRFRFQ